MSIIECHGLRKTYGTGEVAVEALRGVDLAAQKGELLAIMGPSGSGKSTLMHILGGIEVPTAGHVLLEGRDLAGLNDDQRTIVRRQRIGFVFQKINLLPTLTAEENVALPLLLDGIATAEAHRRSIAMLELVGLGPRSDHLPSKLSGGEQQRVAIARALVIEPALVLADEPTGSLDSVTGRQMTLLLRRLVDERQQTMVIVTHDADVAAFADRLIRFRDGHIEHEETRDREDLARAAAQEPGA